jgi:hypothetical protein
MMRREAVQWQMSRDNEYNSRLGHQTYIGYGIGSRSGFEKSGTRQEQSSKANKARARGHIKY